MKVFSFFLIFSKTALAIFFLIGVLIKCKNFNPIEIMEGGVNVAMISNNRECESRVVTTPVDLDTITVFAHMS